MPCTLTFIYNRMLLLCPHCHRIKELLGCCDWRSGNTQIKGVDEFILALGFRWYVPSWWRQGGGWLCGGRNRKQSFVCASAGQEAERDEWQQHDKNIISKCFIHSGILVYNRMVLELIFSPLIFPIKAITDEPKHLSCLSIQSSWQSRNQPEPPSLSHPCFLNLSL